MVPVLLFILYFCAALWVLHRIIKKKKIDLSLRETTLIFSFKVLLGCIYGYIYLHTYGGDDTWHFFSDSIGEYDKLFHNPKQFFADLLPAGPFGAAHGFWQGLAYYLSDLEYWLMVKMLALFNILSRGNYYIDVVFFDFLVCFGPIILFRMLLSVFPDRKPALVFFIFFIPSVTFWLSGIRGEGLVLLCISLMLHYSGRWFEEKKGWQFWLVMAGLLGFLVLRDQGLIIFLPAFFCWTLGRQAGRKATYYYLWIYTGCLCVFLASLFLFPGRNLAVPLAARQSSFFRLHGNTRYALDTLEPTVGGTLRVLPQAVTNTFLRPYIWEARGTLQWLSALDVMAFLILVALALFFPARDRKQVLGHPLVLCFLFYGITQVLLIGYVVPFPGAIVRYKAIPELFLIIGIGISVRFRIYKL